MRGNGKLVTETISIVIATKNESANIERCISSIINSDYDDSKVEIIVVDNSSIDDTKAIARNCGAKVYEISDYVELRSINNFRGAQVNLGVRFSHGEILVFPDADMALNRSLLNDINIKLKFCDALYIPESIVCPGIFGKVRNFERQFYNQTVVDALRVFKREIFESVSGFDEVEIKFGPDDWDLTKKVKQVTNRTWIAEFPVYHDESRLTLASYIMKKFKYSNTIDEYVNKWSKCDPDVKKQLSFQYRFFWVFFENGKWVRVIKRLDLFVMTMFLRFLVGSAFILNKVLKK